MSGTMGGGALNIDVRRDGDVAHVRLEGDVDIATAPTLRSALRELVEDRVDEIRFETSAVDFMDSQGLGVLLMVVRDGIQVTVVSPSPAVRRLLEVSGADTLLAVDE